VRFSNGTTNVLDWIGVYPANCCAPDCLPGSTLWKYTGTNSHDKGGVSANGTVVLDAGANSCNWPLTAGDWEIVYVANDAYNPMTRMTFHVEGQAGATPKCGGAACGGGGGGSSGCGSCSGECDRCSSGHCDHGYMSTISHECVY
jgi:hypothetical protein